MNIEEQLLKLINPDSLTLAGFDHPCKKSCSGWDCGRERAKADMVPLLTQLGKVADFLDNELNTHHGEWGLIEYGQDGFGAAESLKKLKAMLAESRTNSNEVKEKI